MRQATSLANVRSLPRPPRITARPRWLPPLNSLHTFEAAGRLLNFKAAAAELCVTPSAVSRQIKVLEDQLGVALFVRTSRAVALTAAGREYLDVVRSAFASLAAGTGAVRRAQQHPIVRLSLKQPLAANWLAPRLADFSRRHPGIEIQTVTGNELVSVDSGEFDLAIRFGHGSWPGVRVDRLFKMSLFPVCSPALREGNPGLRNVRDLAHHPWLHFSQYPHAFRAWLAHAGAPDLDSSRHFTFDSVDVLCRAAEQGLGVAIATRVYASPYLEASRLICPLPIECPLSDAYYLVARGDLAREPAAAAVHAWLLEAARATQG